MAKQGLGELLVQEKVISAEQLAQAKTTQTQEGGKLSRALIKHKFVSDEDILGYIAQQYQLQTIDLGGFEIDKAVIAMVSKEICLKHNIIPVMMSLGTLVVACSEPGNMFIKDDLTFITQSKIELVVASEPSILEAIGRYYDQSNIKDVISNLEEEHAIDEQVGNVMEDSDEVDEPIIKFVNFMFLEAVKARVSDIHIEPYESRFRIRFRIDGTMHERIQPPGGAARAIANRIKILSGLDISEKRRPQDGRIKIRQKNGNELEFRVSTVPSIAGEKIVLRLLDKSGLGKPMAELGFEEDDLNLFKQKIAMPVGIVLMTGPTGSGKSTTVYSAINQLNTPEVNICTAEDPVEMSIEGVNQVAANPSIDLGFSDILRSFLRQDPDVIFVGEIRDYETADISFKAASTGHLVISTLHTNDAPATVVRLTEMGIAPFLVAATVNLIVAQRLIGRICEACKVDERVSPEVLRELEIPQDQWRSINLKRGEGCSACNYTGIRGRVAIHELMDINGPLRDAILRSAPASELRKIAVANGMRSLRGNAILKLMRGLTTIEEVLSSTVKD